MTSAAIRHHGSVVAAAVTDGQICHRRGRVVAQNGRIVEHLLVVVVDNVCRSIVRNWGIIVGTLMRCLACCLQQRRTPLRLSRVPFGA